MIEVFCHGGCRPSNPKGIATFGWVAYLDGALLQESRGISSGLDEATNIEADALALLRTLEQLLEKGHQSQEVTVRGSIRANIDLLADGGPDVKWEYRREDKLNDIRRKIVAVAECFPKVTFLWIRRSQNERAAELSHLAYWEAFVKPGLCGRYTK